MIGAGNTLGAALMSAFEAAEDRHGQCAWIYGVVTISDGIGPDYVLDRGRDGSPPLEIDHRWADWGAFDRAMKEDDAAAVEAAYVHDVIGAEPDLDHVPTFPGDTYRVIVA